jgi:hypothetical protein
MRYRELFENEISYYLGSTARLSGIVRRGDLKMSLHPHNLAVEQLLEDTRPADSLPRASCVFLADSPEAVSTLGMPTDFLYRATPVGRVQRSDPGWWHLIQEGLALGKEARPPVEEWAAQYWMGAECIVRHGAWEYRAEAADVLAAIR